MNISRPFVSRPIATLLLLAGMLLLGGLSYELLPLAPLPQVDFPTIAIEASLPGASAETMASSVAAPLERSLTNISGISSMTSSSSLGTVGITIQFDLNKNIDAAAQEVQTALSAANSLLPKALPNPPTYHKVNPADFTILSLALTSDIVPLTELDRFADDFLAGQISQLPGVGLVDFHGEQKPAIRIRVDPDALARLSLTLEDVRGVLGVSTVDAPKGTLDGPAGDVILDASDQLFNASAYRDLILAYRNGAPIRVHDIGTAIDAAEDIRQAAWLQDRRAIIIDVHKQPGYNVVETIERIKANLPRLMALLPASVDMRVVGDRTQTIRASVHEVQWTLMVTVILVVLVMFAFLRDARATLIPSITIPLSFVGTFVAMHLLGYSIDNISLMALTIAVGFVVDDAIVVIENTMRHVDAGVPPLRAAVIGAGEVGFTVVSMTLSLIAVFIPVLLMNGIIGRIFREFAVTLSVAVLMSGVIALTATPMLCSRLITDRTLHRPGRISRAFSAFFDIMQSAYAHGLRWVLVHSRLTLAVTISTLGATCWLYVLAPKGFFPQQDTGLIMAVAEAAPNVSFQEMSNRIQALVGVAMSDPAVDNVYSWIGSNPTLSQGRLMINLKPISLRDASAAEIMARLKPRLALVEGAALFMQVRQDIQVGGRTSKTQFQYTLQDADSDELAHWSHIIADRLKSLAVIQDVTSDIQAASSRLTMRIDRDTASRMGISAQMIDDTLYDAFGQRQVGTIFTQLNQFHVVLELDPRFQRDPSGLAHLYIRSPITGNLVPLPIITSMESALAPITINHQGSFPSITLSFNLAPSYALGDAVSAVNNLAREIDMPATIHSSFQGTAQVFQASLANQPLLILSAIIAVYIILGILYESFIHPLTILSTLPSAGIGALVALRLFHQDLSIMGLIGILLLIGIVKKNAIMMIDFALVAERENGLLPEAAILQASLLRFRPIMMTTMAALLGALPLAFGQGVGAELRQPLGITIVGGLLVSQILTLFTTPVIYCYLSRMAKRTHGRRTADSAMLQSQQP